MTIKDIANLAGVSASTVSKIINRKDDNISEETRKRVLQIIKESEYVPYAGVRDKLLANNNSIALIIPSLLDAYYSSLFEMVRSFAASSNYTVALYSYDSYDSELTLLHELSDTHISGIIYVPTNIDCVSFLGNDECNIKNVILLDCGFPGLPFPTISRDFTKVAETAALHLIKHGSRKLFLMLDEKSPSHIRDAVVSGFKTALSSSGLSFVPAQLSTSYSDCDLSCRDQIDSGVDAIICQNPSVVGQVFQIVSQKRYLIPEDISLICLEDSEILNHLCEGITALCTDVEEMAKLSVDAILSQVSSGQIMPFSSYMPYKLVRRNSVKGRSKPKHKIVVVGSINMDVTMKVPRLPHSGETVLATSQSSWPGGKGANQAIGVSRFGADSYMIGRLGNDLYGKQLYDRLSQEHVSMQGVTFSNDLPSGTAYINVQSDGLNTIVVNPGANKSVGPEYINKNRSVFEDAHYCLIQMEIPLNTIEEIIKFCKEMNVKVILKPSPVQKLSPYILDNLFLLIPNQEEIDELIPDNKLPEEQAQAFIRQGVQNVIVTLGDKGCIHVCKEGAKKYAAIPYPSIDSTGASDIFISCLAAQLVKGKSMDESIKIATLAASYSVSKEGVQNAIISSEHLEELYNEIGSDAFN